MKTIRNFLNQINKEITFSADRNFILGHNENISYQMLEDKVITAANYFRTLNISRQKTAPILCSNSHDYIISILALWILGAIPVLLNTRLTAFEIEEQLSFLGSNSLIIDTASKEKVSKIKAEEILIPHPSPTVKIELENIHYDKNETALIMFTSGSSGKSKAVKLTFSNLIQSAKIGNKYLMQNSEDRWLASLPFYHIGGFSIIFRALMFGSQIVLPSELKLPSIIQSIREFRPTLVSLVSSQMQELLEHDIKPPAEIRHVLLGGGFIDSNLIHKALNRGWKVSKVYGSTETSSFVTVLNPDEFFNKPESVGRPIPPNQIFVCDENGQELPPNSLGEIVVAGRSIMKGYWKDNETADQRIKNNSYLTGDIGYKDEDGYLYLINRRTDLIVSGGENVNPTEVENAIKCFPKVKDVCVFGINDVTWGQRVAAAIVPNSNQKFSLVELKKFLGQFIAQFKIPKEIYFVDELPKTELGKIKREEVRNLFS